MLRRSIVVVILACGACGGGGGRVAPKPQPVPASSPLAREEPAPRTSQEGARWLQAIVELDDTSPRSVDAATRAADAIGQARLAGALPALVGLAKQPVSKRTIAAHIGAIRAIGKLEQGPAAAALIELLARPRPVHPRLATSKDQQRALEEGFALYLATTGATINALAELRAQGTVKPLLRQLYETPELAVQLRRAIVASGPGAADEVRKVLRGESAEINQLFRDHKLGVYCGDKNDAPADQCQKTSAMDFYAALLLGDLHDPRSAADLLAAVKRPALPAYYLDDQAGPTQHMAIFDALRKLGSAEAAAPLRALWTRRDTDLLARIGAVGAYAFVAPDDAGVDELGKIAADNTADDQLRQEAATAFARLAREPRHIAVLVTLAKRYLDASAKQRRLADDKPKRTAEAADAALAKVKLALDTAKTELLAMTRDAASTADQIRAKTDAAKRAEEDFKLAKQAHRDKASAYKQLDSAARAYLGYARLFQTHVARIEIAIRCKDDLQCYAKTLALTNDEAAANVRAHITDVDTWTPDEKLGLVEASVERAMLELGRRGTKAAAFTDLLLDHAKSDNRLIRQSILLALPRIAALPCTSCAAKLDAAIKAGEGKTTLGELNAETTLLRNYFEWAR